MEDLIVKDDPARGGRYVAGAVTNWTLVRPLFFFTVTKLAWPGLPCLVASQLCPVAAPCGWTGFSHPAGWLTGSFWSFLLGGS